MAINKKLKGLIVTKFGNQANFADKIKMHESFVSMVIRGRRQLSDEHKKIWEKALNIKI